MTVALTVGCCVAGGAVAVILPVQVVASPDGRTVAEGPSPTPSLVLRRWWGWVMIVATAAVWGGFAAQLGAAWDLPAYLALGAGLVALTVIDLQHQLLPRRLVVPVAIVTAALLGVAALATDAGDALVRAVACAGGAYAAFWVLRFVNPRGIGGGDVTLAGLLGLALGWHSVEATVWGLAAGAILAAVFAIIALASGRVAARTAITYGPFLVAGALLVLYAAPDGRLFG